jgi:hypothetical protein
MAKFQGPSAPVTSGTIAASGTDYSLPFTPSLEGTAITCSVIATGGTSGTVTCTFQASFDGTNWWDLTMTGTFTFTGGATTQINARVLSQLSGGGGTAAAMAAVPAPYIRLKIANGAAASITAVQVYWFQQG